MRLPALTCMLCGYDSLFTQNYINVIFINHDLAAYQDVYCDADNSTGVRGDKKNAADHNDQCKTGFEDHIIQE